MSFDTKWAGASDIISDILKAKEAIGIRRKKCLKVRQSTTK